MFLAKPGHAERIPDTVECRAAERLLLSKGVVSRKGTMGRGRGAGGREGGDGLASANAESPSPNPPNSTGP